MYQCESATMATRGSYRLLRPSRNLASCGLGKSTLTRFPELFAHTCQAFSINIARYEVTLPLTGRVLRRDPGTALEEDASRIPYIAIRCCCVSSRDVCSKKGEIISPTDHYDVLRPDGLSLASCTASGRKRTYACL